MPIQHCVRMHVHVYTQQCSQHEFQHGAVPCYHALGRALEEDYHRPQLLGIC